MSDWRDDLRKCAKTAEGVRRQLPLSAAEVSEIAAVASVYKLQVPNHVFSLIDPTDPADPIRKQFIPSGLELKTSPAEYDDVTSESEISPVEGLVHRYPSKVLLLPTSMCGGHCRFCFRRKTKGYSERSLTWAQIKRALQYVRSHPRVNEIILTGGDPLVLDDERLEAILREIRSIPSVTTVRVHTRVQVTLPSRVTPQLARMLRQYGPVFAVMHFNHARELSAAARNAIEILVDSGIPCFSQTALLQGVNDTEESLRDLFRALVENRVKPYNLFHTDPLAGLGHFRVSLARGLEMMSNLYNKMSGLAYPLYVFNAPGGECGHVLLGPSWVRSLGPGEYILRTPDGGEVRYSEPAELVSQPVVRDR
jgi:lysine 2,3-aminomutase